MLAGEIMTTPVVTITEDATVHEALSRLDYNQITAMPVIDRLGRIVGVLSEADVLRDLVDPDPRAGALPPDQLPEDPPHFVHEVMSRHPITVSETTDLAAVAELMATTAVKSIPVVHDRHVVGIVSRRDIVHLFARADRRVAADVSTLLAEAGERHWRVHVSDGLVTLTGRGDARSRRVAELLARTVPGVVRVHVVPEEAPADLR